MNLASSGAADYLIGQSRELLPRLFWENGNHPLEFSQVRLALEAHGVRAEHSGHWGILAASLKDHNLFESVGRGAAVAASRNGATNQLYRLSPAGWSYAQLLAEVRGWVRVERIQEARQVILAI